MLLSASVHTFRDKGKSWRGLLRRTTQTINLVIPLQDYFRGGQCVTVVHLSIYLSAITTTVRHVCKENMSKKKTPKNLFSSSPPLPARLASFLTAFYFLPRIFFQHLRRKKKSGKQERRGKVFLFFFLKKREGRERDPKILLLLLLLLLYALLFSLRFALPSPLVHY